MADSNPILVPVIALVLWTFVMWAWMYVTRVPAVIKARMKMDQSIPNGVQMSQLPARVRWKADNYNHLLQMPILFYAVALTLAILGAGHGLNLALAWAYVGSRVIHSLHQALWNWIELRFTLFIISSLILLSLTVRTAILLCGS